MELNYFIDHLFDLLNESDLLDAQDIRWGDKTNTFQVVVYDGSKFDVYCDLSK